MAGLKIATANVSKTMLGIVAVKKIYLGTNKLLDNSVPITGRLYVGTSTVTYEVDPTTFVTLNSHTNSAGTGSWGLGGQATDKLYRCDTGTDKIYKMDIDSLTDLQTITPPNGTTNPYGVEGTSTRLFMCFSNKIFEIDPASYSIIGSATGIALPNNYGRDVGCMNTRLYLKTDQTSGNNMYELDPTTLTYISASANKPTSTNTSFGIGGTYSRLFITNQTTDRIYELDPTSFAIINSQSTITISNPVGIGGTKVAPV
jgi:hypothetical protein